MMCGIAGVYKRIGLVPYMLERIRHRGPDAMGVSVCGPAVVGHVRLSILDTSSASDQPYAMGDSGWILAYNGECWNYRKLRAMLESRGRSFRTTGDTEVVGQLLEEFGMDGLKLIDGMFALSWTNKDGRGFLARDRFGKIPLNVYGDRCSGFAWCSEARGLDSIGWSGSKLMDPGTFLDLETGETTIWYEPKPVRRQGKDILQLLRESVHARMVSDVPVCCLLSGGLDSTAIYLLARELNPDIVPYHAYHDPESPDLAAARRLCSELGVQLREVHVPDIGEAAARESVQTIETSMKTQVEIGMLCLPLARRIHEDGFKVVLSGEGADELFGGYGSMSIKFRELDDAGWTELRKHQVVKMARGNFVRTNKTFMAHSVECRTPFFSVDMVEHALSLTRAECPAGKGALKDALASIVPEWVSKRTKQTFQGAAGVIEAMASQLDSPTKSYNAMSKQSTHAATPAMQVESLF